MTTRIEPLDILLVEDDPGDVLLTREAFAQNRIQNVVTSVKDGVEAMAYLRRQPPYQDAVRPDLILLDLNLPRKSGREVLVEVKSDAVLRSIPVIVLTTSTSPADVGGSYAQHANLYIHKPVDLTRFLAVIRQLDEFFVSVVRLPPKEWT